MKGLYKKIGIGAVALSLILGGSLSNGLIAHASSVQSKSSQKVNQEGIEVGKSDRQIVKGAKNIYEYGIMGFYEKGASKQDIEDYLGWFPEDEDRVREVLCEFKDGKEFLQDLYKNGVQQGVYRVKIGKEEYILLFKEDIGYGIDWNQHLDKWIDNNGDNMEEIDDI